MSSFCICPLSVTLLSPNCPAGQPHHRASGGGTGECKKHRKLEQTMNVKASQFRYNSWKIDETESKSGPEGSLGRVLGPSWPQDRPKLKKGRKKWLREAPHGNWIGILFGACSAHVAVQSRPEPENWRFWGVWFQGLFVLRFFVTFWRGLGRLKHGLYVRGVAKTTVSHKSEFR